TLGHYVDFAEILTQVSCLALALLLALDPRRRLLRLCLALSLIALAAALFLTETRAALGALAIGGFLSVLLLAQRRTRIWAMVALALFMTAAALWIYHTRGSLAFGDRDPGTQFRTMMWEDGFRLIGQHPWFGVGMETIRNH